MVLAVISCVATHCFSQDPDNRSCVCTMNADGSDLKTLVRVEPYHRHMVPRWSPDGREIIFDVSWKDSGEYDPRLFKIPAAGGKPIDLGLGKQGCWSPDGKQIAFRIPPDAGAGVEEGVWIMNSDGEGRQHLLRGFTPVFSPDGSRIACTSAHEGRDNIYIYDVLEGTTRKIDQPYNKVPGYPAWSPDGKELAFIGVNPGNDPELVTMPADGSAPPKIRCANSKLAQSPSWRSDGRLVLGLTIAERLQRTVFFDLRERASVANSAPAEQEEPKSLEKIDESQTYRDPAWSPDGKKIVVITGQEWPN
jgi:Tol biopolymer transport system component